MRLGILIRRRLPRIGMALFVIAIMILPVMFALFFVTLFVNLTAILDPLYYTRLFIVTPFVTAAIYFVGTLFVDLLTLRTLRPEVRDSLAAELSTAWSMPGYNVLICKDYLVGINSSIQVIPMASILWYYFMEHSSDAIVSNIRSFKIIIRTDDGKTYEFGGIPSVSGSFSEQKEEMMQFFLNRLPRVLYGRSKENGQLYERLCKS